MDPAIQRAIRANEGILRFIAEQVIQSAHGSGRLSAAGLAKMTMEEVVEFVREEVAGFTIRIDHRDDLLTKAQEFAKENDHPSALMFMAVFFEHSLNSIIIDVCHLKKIPLDAARQLVRNVNFEGKITWVLAVLKLPPLNATHLKVIRRTAAERNAYIHYKYPQAEEFASPQRLKAMSDLYRSSRRAATYLKAYETRNVFGVSKRRLRQLMKSQPAP